MAPPKKYIKINGVMKMNPEYKKWKDAQSGAAPSKTPVNHQALPVVSNMDDHMELNENMGHDIPLAEATNATIEMMQEPEISLEAGMQPDEMVDQLGAVLGKYEVPMGLMNKRKFIVYDAVMAIMDNLFCGTLCETHQKCLMEFYHKYILQ
jgi:hypothetical protein